MNLLHIYLRETKRAEVYPRLVALPREFSRRSEMAWNRLAASDKEGLLDLRKQGYDALCAVLDAHIDACATTIVEGVPTVNLEAMTKRQWTVFKYLHRYWCVAARKYTQTLVTWGTEAFRRQDGILCYRGHGGNLNEVVYNRVTERHLKSVLSQSVEAYRAVLTVSDDVNRALAESQHSVVEYLRSKRAYLRAFDGRLKAPIQGLMDELRQWVLYTLTGDDRADLIGRTPLGIYTVEAVDAYVEEDEEYDGYTEDEEGEE